MAFSLSGILGRISRPAFYGLGQNVEIQVRGYAARRGTREKRLKIKRALKLKKAAEMAVEEKRNRMINTQAPEVKKTVDSNLPPPPTHLDVFFMDAFQPVGHTIVEAVECHKENLHPSVLGSAKAKVKVFFEFDMTAEKSTRIISPWKSFLNFPHTFDIGFKRRLLVLCEDSQAQTARDAGAEMAGGVALIKEIKRGDVSLTQFDKVIGQLSMHEEISSIRNKLKNSAPKTRDGTLVVDFLDAIHRYHYGVEYAVNLSRVDKTFAWTEVHIGNINMESKNLEENFLMLLKDVEANRPKRDGPFITYAWCVAAPSKERFKITLDPYIQKVRGEVGERSEEADDDEP